MVLWLKFALLEDHIGLRQIDSTFKLSRSGRFAPKWVQQSLRCW